MVELIGQLLTDTYYENGSFSTTAIYQNLPKSFRDNPQILSLFYNICDHQHSEDLPAAIFLPNFEKGIPTQVYDLIKILSDEHYRPKLFLNTDSSTYGDYGHYEVWPSSIINIQEWEVICAYPNERGFLGEPYRYPPFTEFNIDLVDDLLETPSKIRSLIFPTWDKEELVKWHDRQFSRRKNDFFLSEDILRVKWIMDNLRELKPKSLLEVGIWGADLAWQFPKFDFIEKCYLVDISKCSLKKAEERINDDRFNYLHGFCEEIPLEDSSVDVAIAGEVMEHVLDPEKALQELRRVVKSGGSVLITVPDWVETNIGHLRIFNPNEFLKGENIDCLRYVNGADSKNRGWLCRWNINKL